MIESYFPDFEKHMLILKGLTKSSVAAYVETLKEFDRWLEGNAYEPPVTLLTREIVEYYLEHCFYQGNSNGTRLTKLTALGQFFRFLQYKRIMPENICDGIPRPKQPKKFVQRFTKEETLRMFRAIDITTEKGQRDVCIIALGVFAGLRNDEVCSITLNDLADERNQITLNVEGKGNKQRSVWLWASPSVFLRMYMTVRLNQGAKGTDPLLVTYKNGGKATRNRLTHDAVDDLVKVLAKRAGIRKAVKRFHMFRASHIHDLRHVKGFDAAAIAKRVGHSSIATTDRYMPDRDRIHRVYNSLHEYWIEFPKLWNPKEEAKHADSNINHDGGAVDAKN